MSIPHNFPSPFLGPRFYNKPEKPIEVFLKKKKWKNLKIKNIKNPSKKDEKQEINQAQKKEDNPKKMIV